MSVCFPWRVILIAGTIALAGCSHSPPTRTLTIDFVPPVASPISLPGTPQVRVARLRLPAALDRVEVVSQSSPDELEVDDFAHWGAPVDQLGREALSLDLSARLPDGGALVPPVRPLELSVDVLSFSIRGGRATMQVSWSATAPPRAAPVAGHLLELSVPATGTGSLATAAALSGLTAKIADDVAAGLKALAGEPVVPN